MLNIIPVVAVVYKSKDGNWRGFCYPYDLSCNADTKEEAKENIVGLIETYEESLKRHGNPRHLIEKQLSDKEDQEKFKKVWPMVSKKMAEVMKTASSPAKYSNYLSQDRKFSINSGEVSYFHRGLSIVGTR